MLQKIRALVGSKEDTLYESLNVKVIEKDDQYVFVPDGRDVRGQVIVGSNRYDLENDEMNFSKELIQRKNAAVYQTRTEFVVGESTSDETVDVFLSPEQAQKLSGLRLNRGDNILSNNTDVGYEVYILDNMWCISLSGLMDNIPYHIELSFTGGLPDIMYEDVNGSDGVDIDISDMEERYIGCSVPSHMSGEFLVNKSSTSFERLSNETLPLTEFMSSIFFVSSDEELSERIQRWNNAEIQVVARPERYTNVSHINTVSESVTMFKFDATEFDELATIELEYPEHIDVSPWISHRTTDYDSDIFPDYIKNYEYEDGVHKFIQSVYPSEEVVIFHGDMLYFEDNSTRTSIEVGETRRLSPELTQKKVEFKLENDYNESVILNLNETVKHINSGNSASVEVSLEEKNSLSIETAGGKEIASGEISREKLLRNSNTEVTELSSHF